MQKNNNRTPMNTAKVAKKAKKMGTPSPPKKKKSNEIKIGDTVINTSPKTPKTKTPVKKIAVVARKSNVGKKELKVTVKKKTPIKIPAQISKIIKKPVAKRVKLPKIILDKSEKTDKTDKTEKPEKPEKKVTTPKQFQLDKTTEKNEEIEVVIPKAKKLKKSEEECAKTTAKKQNSKLSKKSNDTEPAVKPLPSSILHVEIVKDVAKNKKLNEKIDKKSGLNSEKSEDTSDEAKSKGAPKKKLVKIENKVVKKIPVEKKIVKKVQKIIKAELIEEIDKNKKDDVPKVEQPEKKPVKKEPVEVEKDKDKEKDKKQNEETDKDTKETIAKLLKEVNKTILKSPTKKKRETLNSKTSPNNSIMKKSKIIAKPKPKKQEILIKVKTESIDTKDEVIQSPQKKVVKKLVAKPKKKVVIKTEEESDPKKEKPKKPEKEVEDKSKTVDDEKNTNTDDSTTSDEITLNLLRQTQTSSPSQTQSQPDKKPDEPVKPKIKKKIKAETSSDTDRKSKPIKQIKKTVVKKIQQKKKMLLLKNKMRKIAKERKRSTSTDTEQKNRKLKLYSWWTGPKRHRVASLNALAKVHCLYENESRGALYDCIKRSPVTKDSNSEAGDPDHEMDHDTEPSIEPSTRTLRSVPGLRGVGKHWEMHDETSSSSCEEEASNDSSIEAPKRKLLTPPPSYKQKEEKRKEAEKKPEEKDKVIEKKKPVRKRRNRTELIMDLKDMVVRKRMASLNASAILAASYSVEKKPFRSPKSESSTETSESDDSMVSDTIEKEFKRKCYDSDISVKKEESSDRKVIEVRASPNKKVAVILNQDTDVTITGVYVNSTTRSTHHEGYCSIAGMQYRISATSHTQTAATAVATETLLHSGEHGLPEQPCKSYTPLGALSNMQPPGSHPHAHTHGHGHPPHVVPPTAVSPTGRRHGCTSAFAAPPPSQYGPPHHHHHGPHPPPPPPPLVAADQQPPPAYIHGYYQPAGPLITAHHGHSHPPPAPAGKTAPLPTLEASPSPTPPPTTHQPPPSSTGTAESSDNEVIITSASSGSAEQVPVALPAAQTYRYATSSQYPPGSHAPPGYSYSYPPSQFYHSAPAGFAQQQHYHHDICYPGSAYPPSYLHPKAYTTTFRRYLPPPPGPQYYSTNPELYSAPPSSGQNSQVVTASSGAGGSSYQQPPTGPPPPTLVESYAPPPPVPPTIVEPYPPPHYYTPSYGSGPAPPPCYSHSPPTRNLAFIEPAYQSCPCPMQSCPKNVHTGPLTGDGKRSNAIAKESMPLPQPLPLPPVALALPLEPASVAGPPSPARGSAGMPPPPSPAGATYQPTPTPTNTPNKWDSAEETQIRVESKTQNTTNTDKRNMNKPRLGKNMVRNTILNNNNNNNTISNNNNNNTPTQGMLLMCHQTNNQQQPQQADVKREVESPEEQKPTPETVVEIPNIIEQNQTDPKQTKTKTEAETEPETEPDTETETETEMEVQNNINDECSKRLSPDDDHLHLNNNQKCKSEECADEATLLLQNGPLRRKSNLLVEETLPQRDHAITIQNETINHLEKTCTKRKLSIEDQQQVTQSKKQKPNPNSNAAKPRLVSNGSYKNLIKRNNNNKCIKINNGKRKLILESELKAAAECKTPKIILGKNKKTTKRKNNNAATKEEPAIKKLKPTKPLIERNLHTLKQSVRHKDKQQHQELIENKEPVISINNGAKKTIQRKNQVNSKCSSTLKNVERTIESVILNCAYVDETLRTSDSVLLKQVVVDKQNNNNKHNCNNKQTTISDLMKITETATTTTATTTTTTATTTTKQNPTLNRAAKIGCGRAGTTKRKSKDKPLLAIPLPVARIPRRSFNLPKWSNGWSWEGDCFQGKVFINSDEPLVVRKCYPAMRHQEGDVISPRDCVLLKAGPRKIDLPFVAKVAALWEDDEGEMMMSLLWYYRPEHTEQGRRPIDQPDEVFASRHKDTNSVACIEDKCYVLTFNEYCRYRKKVRRIEEGMEQNEQIVPLPEGGQYYREHRQPPALLATAPDLVFFCRQVYDFRQKRIVKNPS